MEVYPILFPPRNDWNECNREMRSMPWTKVLLHISVKYFKHLSTLHACSMHSMLPCMNMNMDMDMTMNMNINMHMYFEFRYQHS